MRKGPGRPKKIKALRTKNAGFCAYPEEIAAISKVAKAKKFRKPFDYVRSLLVRDDHPLARNKISAPRAAK